MKKFYTIILFSICSFISNAQNLQYPEKNCEGANAAPEGLHSWCSDNIDDYYNECECQHEKALKAYEAQKEKLQNELSALYKEKQSLIDKSRSHQNAAREFRDKLVEEKNSNFESDKKNALAQFSKAKPYLQQALVIEERIQSIRAVLSVYGTKDDSGINRLNRMKDQLDSDIDFVRNMEPRKNYELTGNYGGSGRGETERTSKSAATTSTNSRTGTDTSNENTKSTSTSASNNSTSTKNYDRIMNEAQARSEARLQMMNGDTQGAVRTLRQAGLNEEADLVPVANALSSIDLGEFKAANWIIMGGTILSKGEEAPEDYSGHSFSFLFQGKGRFFAMEYGLKYTNNYYYEAAGTVLGVGFGFGNDNTGVIFLGGFDGYVFKLSSHEEYKDESGDYAQFGVPYNLSATLYHGTASGIGLVLKFYHYFGDALLTANDELGFTIPNPYPSSHLSFGIAL